MKITAAKEQEHHASFPTFHLHFKYFKYASSIDHDKIMFLSVIHWTPRCQLDLLHMKAPGKKGRMQRQACMPHGAGFIVNR